MVRKDIVRMLRIWPQTLLPSVVTTTLYFLVFGMILGPRIGAVGGVPYIVFVVPGLIMLAVITASYANTSFTFFTSKFFSRSIDEILVSPTPPWLLVAGFAAGGVIRGLLVGTLVLIVALIFTGLSLTFHNSLVILLFILLSALIFSLAGLVNGIYATSIDGINIVPTFILTPLIYLGGVFYSVHALPGWWQTLTHANPLFYLINGLRQGFLGTSDVPLATSADVLLFFVFLLTGINWHLIRTGLGLKQ